MKYCKDCRNFVDSSLTVARAELASCLLYSKATSVEDPVVGVQSETRWVRCREAREAGGPCGPEAKGFELRAPPPSARRWRWFGMGMPRC